MPITIPESYNTQVYSKIEIDSLLLIKADKVGSTDEDNVSVLAGDDGNIVDSEIQIGDLLVEDIEGEVF